MQNCRPFLLSYSWEILVANAMSETLEKPHEKPISAALKISCCDLITGASLGNVFTSTNCFLRQEAGLSFFSPFFSLIWHILENRHLGDPGLLLQCFGTPLRCPGGLPGTCAAGRDLDSVACSSCLSGLQPTAEERDRNPFWTFT